LQIARHHYRLLLLYQCENVYKELPYNLWRHTIVYLLLQTSPTPAESPGRLPAQGQEKGQSLTMNKPKPSEALPGARSVLLPLIFCGAMGISQALSCLSPPTWHGPGILDASGRILHPMICVGWGREVLQRAVKMRSSVRAVLELRCAKSTGEGGETGKIADKGAKEVSKKKRGKVSGEVGGYGGPGGPAVGGDGGPGGPIAR